MVTQDEAAHELSRAHARSGRRSLNGLSRRAAPSRTMRTLASQTQDGLSSPSSGGGTPALLLHASWMSIALGVSIEILVLCVTLPGGSVTGVRAIVAETLQKVSWSWIVCVGLTVGSAASKLRIPAMGISGLLAAPLGFHIARILHRSASQAMGIPLSSGTGPSPWVIAAMKGLEYGFLGLALGWVSRRTRGGMAIHAATGFICSLVFGGLVLWLTFSASDQPIPMAALAPRVVNEVIHPVGCALVVFGSGALAKSLRTRPIGG